MEWYVSFSETFVKISVMNLLGETIVQLVGEQKQSGNHVVEFNTNTLKQKIASGTYLFKIEADNFIEVKKMILLK